MSSPAGSYAPDAYRWLEDDDDPRTTEWCDQQRDRYRRHLATHTSGPDAIQPWAASMDRLTGFAFDEAPSWRGDRAFVLRRETDGEHELVVRITPQGETTVVDPQTIDPSGNTALDRWEPDTTGDRIAYQLSYAGAENGVLHVRAIDTGCQLIPPVPGCRYSSVAWWHESLFLARPDDGGHRLDLVSVAPATPAGDMVRPVVMPSPNLAVDLELAADPAGRWLALSMIDSDGHGSIWVADLINLPLAGPKISPGWRLLLAGDGWNDLSATPDGKLLIITSIDAPNGRVLLADPETVTCRQLVSEHPDMTVDGALPHVVLRGWRGRHFLHEIVVTGPERELPLPVRGHGTVSALSIQPDTGDLWLTCSDVLTAPTTYVRPACSGSRWRRTSGTAPEDLPQPTLRYDSCTSADGVRIDLQIVEPPGPARPLPTLLTAYGAFGVVRTSTFHPPALAWAQAGGRFVMVAVRGGGEHGEQWHQAATGVNKQRSVDDFIAAARHVRPQAAGHRLAAIGESAGGLLVAAAITQQPQLFTAAVCVSPLTDMLRSEVLGLGAEWIREFGTVTNPDEHAALRRLSPLHQVAYDTAYPAVLIAVADNDSRVPPAHGRKFCAALQTANSSHRPILLRQESSAGHGWSARHRRISRHAETLHFLYTQLTQSASL